MVAQGRYKLSSGKIVTSVFVSHMMHALESLMADADGETAAMELVEHCQNPEKVLSPHVRDLLRQLRLVDGKGRIIGEDERQFILMSSGGTVGLDTTFVDPFI